MFDQWHWYPIRDGDPRARGLLNRHYSGRHHRAGRRPLKVLGPGEYILLMTADGGAVFAWVHNTIERLDQQVGIYCPLFRRESGPLASLLIHEACLLAWDRWPGDRLFTYVDPGKVASRNPGYCFLQAGFRREGYSQSGKLLLARYPAGTECPTK